MNTAIKKIESRIQDIIEQAEDTVKVYDKAVENTDDFGLQNYFKRKASERRNFVAQLKNSAPELELGDADIDGSTTGSMRRTWIDVKTFFSGDNDEVMLKEAIRGDEAAIEEFNEALADTHLPKSVADIIREQREIIKRDLNTTRVIEDLR